VVNLDSSCSVMDVNASPSVTVISWPLFPRGVLFFPQHLATIPPSNLVMRLSLKNAMGPSRLAVGALMSSHRRSTQCSCAIMFKRCCSALDNQTSSRLLLAPTECSCLKFFCEAEVNLRPTTARIGTSPRKNDSPKRLASSHSNHPTPCYKIGELLKSHCTPPIPHFI